ncbi:hypothetical protein CRE_09757 [Caenorhabditis remanei]|uniref:Uncharacterized protein n=1 Tax=Caenorhabditis remanei TaxID=31234 RepID=E3N9X7_CAERE|nr:hypothetical protein CRE_09757 [Caenorhabditis remanei]
MFILDASPPTNHQPSSSYSYYNYNFIDTYYNHNFIDTYYNYYPPHTIRHTTTIRVYIF